VKNQQKKKAIDGLGLDKMIVYENHYSKNTHLHYIKKETNLKCGKLGNLKILKQEEKHALTDEKILIRVRHCIRR
jgi:hypothetical protein